MLKRFLLTCVEGLCLGAIGVVAVVVLLGHTARLFGGRDFLNNHLPFALAVLAMALVAALLLALWLRLRRLLHRGSPFLPSALALSLLLGLGFFFYRGDFSPFYSQFCILVGGQEEAARSTLAHQVFASYRRTERDHFLLLIQRAQPYLPAVEEAAQAFGVDPDLLLGIAATESSFLPRTSKDGGKGLFQITRIPSSSTAAAARALGLDQVSAEDPRHNSFMAAATLAHYMQQMRGDLFLGLLAYNIGPANGGLQFIMRQYGVTDFVAIQPYLQQLPRDYPIRVLSHALAFRLWRRTGELPAYEEGLNAVRIQHIGIPGFEPSLALPFFSP